MTWKLHSRSQKSSVSVPLCLRLISVFVPVLAFWGTLWWPRPSLSAEGHSPSLGTLYCAVVSAASCNGGTLSVRELSRFYQWLISTRYNACVWLLFLFLKKIRFNSFFFFIGNEAQYIRICCKPYITYIHVHSIMIHYKYQIVENLLLN